MLRRQQALLTRRAIRYRRIVPKCRKSSLSREFIKETVKKVKAIDKCARAHVCACVGRAYVILFVAQLLFNFYAVCLSTDIP